MKRVVKIAILVILVVWASVSTTLFIVTAGAYNEMRDEHQSRVEEIAAYEYVWNVYHDMDAELAYNMMLTKYAGLDEDTVTDLIWGLMSEHSDHILS